MDLPFPAREDETGGLELPVPSAKQNNIRLLLLYVEIKIKVYLSLNIFVFGINNFIENNKRNRTY